MGYDIRVRIRELLDQKGLNPFEAARKAGLERSFINDLLIGKKQTIREKTIPSLAQVLGCDPEYLAGYQEMPRKSQIRDTSRISLSGVCEAGAWRDPSMPMPDFGELPIVPDPRYKADDQAFYLIRGDHAEGLGIIDGSVIGIVTSGALELSHRKIRAGDVVLVAREDSEGRIELSARQVDDGENGFILVAKPSRGEIPPVTQSKNVKIVGLVLRATRVFGLKN